MTWDRYALAFHGCDAELAQQVVLKKKTLKASTNNYDWLGHGIYFWEGSPDRARKWAIAAAKREDSSIRTPAVLGAVIDLGTCLNLVEAEYLDLVSKAHDQLLALLEQTGTPAPANRGGEMKLRNLDCAVFQMLHESRREEGREPFDTVRAFFVEGEPLYPTAGIRNLDHIQICVRNPAQIIGCFLP